MRQTYQTKKSQLVSVIEPIKYGKNPNQLSPQFGHEELYEIEANKGQEEDLTQLAEAELSIEEVYQEVLNELRAKKIANYK
jgi:hypothetical protein